MRYLLLLASVWAIFASASFAQAQPIDPDSGHIGSSLVRDKTSGFFAVDYVAAHSPADQAGIKVGDLITAIDGISTQKLTETEALHFANGNIGGIVTMTVKRGATPEQPISVTRRAMLDTYSLAADANDPRAEYDLGFFYEFVPYPTRDYTKAVAWYRKSADQGYAKAQVDLAYLTRYGLGTNADIAAATELYRKAAQQGDVIAERELALKYFNGEGVAQSDLSAFQWFYAAARQDDPTAEQYLGFLYRKGRGVVRDDKAAFAWYYRSAERQDPYGEWNLSYLYDNGYGVKTNIGEALKWAQKAQATLPKNENLRRYVALLSLRAFLVTSDSSSLDLSLFMSVFSPVIILCFILCAAFYAFLGSILGFFSFRNTGAPPRLVLAIGWIIFYVESQFVALLAIFLIGKALTADLLVLSISLWGAVPVILFTLGSNWGRIWKPSSLSWGTQARCLFGCTLAIFIMDLSYYKIHLLITGSPIPAQSTHTLFLKAKDSSPWVTLITLSLLVPAAEEILFRGYLLEALRKRCSDIVALLITSFAFAAFHLQWSQFPLLFGMGFIFGWAKLKTGTLRLPLFLHALNNYLALTFAT